MGIKRRHTSLRIIFFQYLAAMVAALILAIVIPYTFFSIGMNTGLYTYANSSEMQAKEMKSKIASTKKFDRSLIPPSCSYVFLSKSFIVIENNMDKNDLKNAIAYGKGQYNSSSPANCYLSIKRNDGICILHYYIGSRYTIEWMNRYIPNPDRLLIIISILNSLLACFIVTTLFARHLKKQLKPLMEATEKIKEQDLDFEIQSSGIEEFNNVLLSISDMKSELKYSLEQQWSMEQTKKQQTSALAHDIKTPLTIIHGNAELLRDSKLTEEQQEYAGYILKNANRMEQYLKMLINLTQAEAGYLADFHKINMKQFIKELEDQVKGLAVVKKLEINFSQRELPEEFTADANLIQRAIMNVISNAAEYSPERGKIIIFIEVIRNCIRFCITDGGKGFSPLDLKQATTQFYMGDKSRGLKAHFGIGLYITETIVRMHKGTLSIGNSTATGGGQVTIEIPIDFKSVELLN